MITFCTARTTLLAAVLLLSAGCSREQQDWRSAEGADTSEAFAHFLEQHPTSELANQARLRIAQLGEESDWHRTDGIATIEAYRQFLAQHPNGKWAEEARIRIEGFSLGSAPRTAQAPANVGAKRTGVNALQLATGVPNPPPPPAAPDALRAQMVVGTQAVPAAPPPQEPLPAAAAAATGYGVQLGAFGTQA
jgi:cell division septation protein DedD